MALADIGGEANPEELREVSLRLVPDVVEEPASFTSVDDLIPEQCQGCDVARLAILTAAGTAYVFDTPIIMPDLECPLGYQGDRNRKSRISYDEQLVVRRPTDMVDYVSVLYGIELLPMSHREARIALGTGIVATKDCSRHLLGPVQPDGPQA